MLSTSQNSLDRFGNNKDENSFWSEGGDIMFCEICGNYVRQYRNRPILNDELTLNNNKSRIKHKNMTEIEFNNNNINNNNQHSDMERKLRVLSIKIEIDNIERHAIIDTGSNLSCIDYSLIKNISQIKSKEKIKITGADNSELEQLGKIDFEIKINKVSYVVDAFVIKGLSCKILLGNDFHIKNNLIINFEDKYLKLNKDIILMDEDLFRNLEGAKYYTCLDLAQRYFQLPIKKEDQYKTAFITDFGLYNFKRIPQGFKNSGPIFQRVINNIFSDYLYRTMIAYLDDICCFGNTFEEALTRLEEIFIRIEEAGLKLKTNKCTILGFEIELLGHKVSNLGVKPLEKNIKAITQFPIPTKVKDDNKFHWNKSQDIAFNTLKNAIITAPVLAHFEDEYPVFVTTDASLEGLSGILEQSDKNGKRHPIGYASRKLKGGEKNFTTTELEMSAVVFAVNYFKEYLLGRKVTVFSDHSSLQYYQTMKNPSSRITKFIFKLLEFDLEIKHRPGLCNQAADCLSRYPVDTLLATDILEVNNKEDLDFDSINLEKLKESQSKDEFCKGIISAINGNNNSKFKRKSRQFLIKDDILFFKNWSPNGIKNLIVVPKTLINVILKSYHESVLSAHFGIIKTLAKLKQKYYWPTIIRDTTNFIKTCISCQMIKKPTGKGNGLLQPIPLLSGKPMQRLTFDYLGPLPTSRGKKYLIVATCNATKMAFAKAVTNADNNRFLNGLNNILWST
ncbi:hypothetical protein QTP88_001961 [Uroleucon formosanum]